MWVSSARAGFAAKLDKYTIPMRNYIGILAKYIVLCIIDSEVIRQI